MSAQTIVLRVKRNITTYFIMCESNDTILNLKKKLLDIITPSKNLKEIQLQIQKSSDKSFVVLEDDHKLDQMGILDDGIVYLVYLNNDGKFEVVNVPEYAQIQESK
jgi:hypothetical protein